MIRLGLALVLCILSGPALAAGPGSGLNLTAIGLFVAFVALTLWITWWAAKRTKSADDFYAAGGRITGFQNGLAIAGDFMSAGAFLGITAASSSPPASTG